MAKAGGEQEREPAATIQRLRRELEAEQAYSEKLVDASRNALLVLDTDLRVRTANKTFCSTFRIDKADAEGHVIYDLGNGAWAIPRLRELLENILTDKEIVDDFVVEHEFVEIGRRRMVLNARKIDHTHRILLEFEDRTEEPRATTIRGASRFRAVLSATTDVIYRMSPDWTEMLQLSGGGFLADTVEPESRWIELYIHPDDRAAVSAAIRKAIDTETTFMLEHRVVRADGTLGWTASRAVPIYNQDGTLEEWLGVASDITPRKNAEKALRLSEERQSFLLRLSDALRQLNRTAEITDTATRLVGEWLGASRVFFVEWPSGEDYGEVFRDHVENGLPSLAGRYAKNDFRSACQRLSSGSTWTVPDVAAETGMDDDERRFCRDMGLVSWVDVPLVKEGELSAALCAVQDEPRDWSAEEIALVEDVAERCWAAIARGRAELQLEQTRERYAHIVAGARDYAIFTMDAGGYITSWPSGAQHVFGWSEREMLGQPFSRTFVSEDVEADEPCRELRDAARDGAAPNIRWQCRKGSELIFIEGETIRLGSEEDVRGFIKIGQDVTERRRAEDRLRESEARLQAIFEGASVGLSEIDSSGRIVLANDEMGRILGRSREEMRALSVSEVTHPDDLSRTQEVIDRVLAGEAGGSGLGLDKRYLRSDGSAVRANSRATLLPGPDGRPGNLLVVTMDLSERWQAEEAVRESEARFRQFGEASSDALWIRDAETLEWEYLNPAFDRIFGTDRQAALRNRGLDFLMNLILPEDREKTRAAIRSLAEGDAVYEYRIRRPSDGAIRWLRTTGFGLGTNEGAPRRLGGITHDMTEEKQAVARMEVLLAELQHRTRNLVGVVRAMASRTIKRSASLDEFAGRFGDRLQALARVNSMLSRLEDGERVTFDALLETELRGYGILNEEDSATQVTTSGPRGIDLPSASVQTLALALHELLTNAAKYGALSTPEGRLAVSWKVIGETPRLLRFEWRETGIEVNEPDGAQEGGYGRELIERALPYQLGAETSYELEPHALRCVVTLPLPKRRRRNRP